MGTRTASSTGRNYQKNHQHPCAHQTRPLKTIWTRNRCIPHRHRSCPIPMQPTNYPPWQNSKTRTTTPMWISLLEIYLHWTKLPNLWSGIFGSNEGTVMLVPLAKRHRNPYLGIHRPHKPQILQGTTQNWPMHCRIPPGTCLIQYSPRVQTRSDQ